MSNVIERIIKQNSTVHSGEEEDVENLLASLLWSNPWQGQQKRQ
jgi:hypothetical protein